MGESSAVECLHDAHTPHQRTVSVAERHRRGNGKGFRQYGGTVHDA